MTDDLVKRLREYAETGNRPSLWPWGMREAADEIERLRNAIKERVSYCEAEIERLRAENATLIATLQEPNQVGYWQRKYEIAAAEIERLRTGQMLSLEELQWWCEADHEDAITLHRNCIIRILEASLEPR